MTPTHVALSVGSHPTLLSGGALQLDIPEIPSYSIRNVSVTSAGLRTRDFLQYSFPPLSTYARKGPHQDTQDTTPYSLHPKSFLQDMSHLYHEGLHNRSKRVNLIIMSIMYSIVMILDSRLRARYLST